MCIGAAADFGGAIVHFEAGGNCPAGFTREHGVFEFLSKHQSCFDGRSRKAPTSCRHRGNGRSRGADDVNSDNRPTCPITAYAFRQAIDNNRSLHSSPLYVSVSDDVDAGLVWTTTYEARRAGVVTAQGRRFSLPNASECKPRL